MKIELKQKKGKMEKISLYLEIYQGSYIDENGKRKRERERS